MMIHPASRKIDDDFLERYSIRIASGATLVSLAKDAIEHVSQEAGLRWVDSGRSVVNWNPGHGESFFDFYHRAHPSHDTIFMGGI
jgi:hypothetical protein